MEHTVLVVEGYVATGRIDLREEMWGLALDQRAFGPRRLVVAFADASGRLLTLAHTTRTDPSELALEACIMHLGKGAAAAVAFCDEPVVVGPPSPALAERFAHQCVVSARHGVHLVDWFSCDDCSIRSSRIAIDGTCDWWDVPT